MPNINKVKPKSNSTDRFYKSTTSSSSGKDAKSGKKSTPKKTVSKGTKDGKCCSAGALSSYIKAPIVQPKKTTKSDVCFTHKIVSKPPVLDYCRKCGDAIHNKVTQQERSVSHSGDANVVHIISEASQKSNIAPNLPKRYSERKPIRNKTLTSQKIPSTTKIKEVSEKITPCHSSLRICHTHKSKKLPTTEQSVKQFYKNENFGIVSQSTQEINKFLKKVSYLDTINEQPESSDDDDDSLFRIYDGSDESYGGDVEGGTEGDEYDSIKKLREFRDDNYFECHSSQSRLKSKGSATSLTDHKCVYRFYLNDRLFPVPLNSDHHKTIRCTECQLPLDLKKCDTKNINGTIQAKVKLQEGDDAQDMVLMLPVKEPLIIKQNRKPKDEEEVVYFGVIKLDAYGNSLFTKKQPTDSLALKYQKGYKEYGTSPEYEYQKSEECEVIVI